MSISFRNVFKLSLFCSPRLYLFDKKYCKTVIDTITPVLEQEDRSMQENHQQSFNEPKIARRTHLDMKGEDIQFNSDRKQGAL